MSCHHFRRHPAYFIFMFFDSVVFRLHARQCCVRSSRACSLCTFSNQVVGQVARVAVIRRFAVLTFILTTAF